MVVLLEEEKLEKARLQTEFKKISLLEEILEAKIKNALVEGVVLLSNG